MKAVESLTREELVDIVLHVQGCLYLEDRPTDDGEVVEVFVPEKDWDCVDICGLLAEKLDWYGLVPRRVGDEPESPKEGCEICGGPNGCIDDH